MSIIATALISPSSVAAATLSLEPGQERITVGEQVRLSVLLDAGGAAVDSIDINALQFDSRRLRVVPSADEGTFLEPGTPIARVTRSFVNEQAGALYFSGILDDSAHERGSVMPIVSVQVEAIATGTARLAIDHQPGSTTDSNVAADGTDVLQRTSGASVVIDEQRSWWQRALNTLLWWS